MAHHRPMLLVNHTPWSVVVWNHYDSPRFPIQVGHIACVFQLVVKYLNLSRIYEFSELTPSGVIHDFLANETSFWCGISHVFPSCYSGISSPYDDPIISLWYYVFPYFPMVFPSVPMTFACFFGKKIRPDHTTESDWFISLEKRCLRSGAIPF